MGFDLHSRDQWDDFRVWFFAGSDVYFVKLVYLMVRAQVPSLLETTCCILGHCSHTDSNGTRMCLLWFPWGVSGTSPRYLLLRFGALRPSLDLVFANFQGPLYTHTHPCCRLYVQIATRQWPAFSPTACSRVGLCSVPADLGVE